VTGDVAKATEDVAVLAQRDDREVASRLVDVSPADRDACVFTDQHTRRISSKM